MTSLSSLLAPYGLILKPPVAERRRFSAREQLRYVDAKFDLRDATDPAARVALLLEMVTIESTARWFDRGLRGLDDAAAVARDLGGDHPLEVQYQRGKLFYRASRFTDSVRELEAVVAAAGQTSLLGRRALLQLGRVHIHQGRFADAIGRLRLGLTGDDHTRSNLLGGCFDLVYAFLHESMLDDAEATLERAGGLVDPRNPAERARVIYHRGWLAFLRRHMSEAQTLLEDASRDFAQLDEADAWACAEIGLARMELEQSELARCAERCERARASPELRPDIAIVASLLRGLALVCAGRLIDAEGDYVRAERLAERIERRDLQCRALEWRAQLHLVQGAPARAVEALTQARDLLRAVGEPLGEAIVLGTMGRALREAGAIDASEEVYAEAHALATRLGNRFELGRLALDRAAFSLAAGAVAEAESWGREALAIYEALGKVMRRALATRYLAEAAALRDEFDVSERLFADSVALLGARPNRIALAETLTARAEARADAGRIDDAVSDLADARALAEAFGSHRLAEACARRVDAIRERHAAQALLGRYLEPKIAARLLASGPRRLAGNISQEATILFSDIRGYTTLTERLGAQEVVALLNEHFTAMTDEIAAEGGTIDKFIGDAVMAVFGDPGRPRQDDARRAVRAAIGMLRRRHALNEGRTARGLAPIEIGVGIDSGAIVMGSIGSARRLTFTVIGDAVNIASRLESLTKQVGADILISSATAARLDDSIATRALGQFDLKGREGKIDVRVVPWG